MPQRVGAEVMLPEMLRNYYAESCLVRPQAVCSLLCGFAFGYDGISLVLADIEAVKLGIGGAL